MRRAMPRGRGSCFRSDCSHLPGYRTDVERADGYAGAPRSRRSTVVFEDDEAWIKCKQGWWSVWRFTDGPLVDAGHSLELGGLVAGWVMVLTTAAALSFRGSRPSRHGPSSTRRRLLSLASFALPSRLRCRTEH